MPLLVVNQAYVVCVKTQIERSTREPPVMLLQEKIFLHPTSSVTMML